MQPTKVSIAKLVELGYNPFTCWPEVDKEISLQEIEDALSFGTEKWKDTTFDWKNPTKHSRQDHVNKIAYFVRHPNNEPIDIDVGVPELGGHVGYIICDGNHRYAAAIYRKVEYIDAFISGSTDYAKELLLS